MAGTAGDVGHDRENGDAVGDQSIDGVDLVGVGRFEDDGVGSPIGDHSEAVDHEWVDSLRQVWSQRERGGVRGRDRSFERVPHRGGEATGGLHDQVDGEVPPAEDERLLATFEFDDGTPHPGNGRRSDPTALVEDSVDGCDADAGLTGDSADRERVGAHRTSVTRRRPARRNDGFLRVRGSGQQACAVVASSPWLS